MQKILVLFVLLCSFLSASYIKDVQILSIKDKDLSIEDIKDSKDFKRTKLPIIRHDKKDFYIKVFFNEEAFKNKEKIVELDTGFNYISLEEDVMVNEIYRNKTLEFSKGKFLDVLYIKVHNEEGYININVNIHDKSEYTSTQILKNKLYGVAYGVLLAAVLYYFALYLFNREKSYIYYSLTQASMLAILAFVTTKEILGDRVYIDFIFFFFFIFSNFFTKHFLNTKQNAPRMHILLNITIAIYVVDLIVGTIFGYYFFEDNMPLSTLLVVYLITAIIVYNQGYKPAFFYLIGWSLVILSFLFIEVQFYFTEDQLLIQPVYLMHIVTPLESLVLAFALAYKMKVLEEEKLEQQQFLTHQSKLASMGEMIGNIAHQWRQPLTHLSYIMMNLKTAFEKERLTKDYFDKKSKEATSQLEFMSHTIDDFRDFFKMSKQKESFLLEEAIDEVINLLKASFKSHKIEVEFTKEKSCEVQTYRGEFLQVLFNLLNNAKDEFVRRDIDDAKIFISLKEVDEKPLIEVVDNAGGIDKDVIGKIFEPYFTTKDKGLGIGLYMSKMIVDKNIGGKLEVSNEASGAKFTIRL